MGKIRQIFIWDGTHDQGPFRRAELVEQLRLGTVLPSHFYFEEGMTDWTRVATLPCCSRFLASDAQKEMLERMGVEYDEFLTKNDVSTILDQQPATERQLALLSYLKIPASADLTKYQASELLETAKHDPLNAGRLDAWNIDRLDLHPEMYARERDFFKEGRAELLLRQYFEFRSDLHDRGANVRKLTIEEMSSFIAQLDGSRPGWDRDLCLNGLDHILDLLKKL
jgi:hypothetical protein